jgi:hypothetical protein
MVLSDIGGRRNQKCQFTEIYITRSVLFRVDLLARGGAGGGAILHDKEL